MTRNMNKRNYIDAIFEILPWPIAAWVLLSQVAQCLGISLASLSVVYSITLISALIWYLRKRSIPHTHFEPPVLTGLLLLAVSCGLLSLLAIHPDADDVVYFGRVIYYVNNPASPLGFVDPTIALATQMPQGWFLFSSIELLWGFLSLCTGLPPLAVYHIALPLLAGSLIPLAWYFALSRFIRRPVAVLAGTATIVLFLCLDGEVHRSFGNFSFVRIWQGKALFMSIGMPLLTGYVCDYLQQPGRRTWLTLTAAFTASTGFTGSALFMIPMALLAWGFGYFSIAGVSSASCNRVIKLTAAAAYIITIDIIVLVASQLGHNLLGYTDALSNWMGIQGLSHQQSLVFVSWTSPSSLLCYASTIIALLVLPSWGRRFIGGWFLTLAIVTFNPVAAPFVIEHLTTHEVFWRLFWVLPFPLTAGLGIAGAIERRSRLVLIPAASLMIFGFIWLATNKSILKEVPLSWASYKLPIQETADARIILKHTVPGPMIAPFNYSWILPLLSASVPQVAPRRFTLVSTNLPQEMIDSRQRAIKLVTGNNNDGVMDLMALVDAGLKNILFTRTIDTRLSARLDACCNAIQGNGWILYSARK